VELPTNRFKQRLRTGESQIGLWCGLPGSYAAEIVAPAGFDWLLFDTEHSPSDVLTVLPQLQAVATYSVSPVVRPAFNDTVLIKRFLDIGVQSLLIPYVQNEAEAADAVAATRYPPNGIRGVPALTRATRFGRVKEYARTAEEEICVLVFSGPIRMSGTLTFMCQYIIPKLPLFLSAHPSIELSLHLDDRNIGLIEQGIDVALRMGHLDDSGLVAKRIGHCRRVVVGTPSYLADHPAPQTPEDLIDHSTVVFAQGEGGDRFTFKGHLGSKTISVRPKWRINATEGVRSAVLAGAGLSVATEWMFEAELNSGAVQEVLEEPAGSGSVGGHACRATHERKGPGAG